METQKHQAIFIRGGEAFDTKEEFYNYLKNREYDPYKKWRSWKDRLERSLFETFDSFTPVMPNKQRADYTAWKIWFEKLFPYLNTSKQSKMILIGHSLGGIFLAKYLAENKFPKQIDQLHLISPVFDSEGLVDETIGNFEFDPADLKNIAPQTEKIFFYHSTDDLVVPIEHTKKFLKHIPEAQFFQFEDRGHFNQPAFIEILQVINKYL